MYTNKHIDINISIMRIFATISVIFLHTCSVIISNPNVFQYTNTQEKFWLFIAKMFRCAVPLFFMITGTLMFQKKKKLTYKIILSKYVKRVLLALLIFGVPLDIAKIYLETKNISIPIIVKVLLCDEGVDHLWYLYVLIGVYLTLPILSNAVQHTKIKSLLAFAVCIFLFDFVVPFISDCTGWDLALSICVSYPIFYCIIGYCISNFEYIQKYRIIAEIITIISIFTIFFTILFDFSLDKLYSYNSPLIAIYSIALFYLFQSIQFKINNEKVISFIWKLDRLCFGAYIIHPTIIQFVYRIVKITPCNFKLYPLATFLFFVCFLICSFIISFILNKIPFFRKYVL